METNYRVVAAFLEIETNYRVVAAFLEMETNYRVVAAFLGMETNYRVGRIPGNGNKLKSGAAFLVMENKL